MKTILPPERVIQGGDLSYLKDMKDTTSYEVVYKDSKGVKVKIAEEDVISLLTIKNATQGTNIQFWDLIKDILENGNNVSPYTTIEDLEVYLEFPVSYLNNEVPVGLHGSDVDGVQLTWAEWSAGGDQPIATSLDSTKCIVRTNIGAVCVDKDEVLILINYAETDADITILCVPELKSLMSSPAYSSE